MAEKLKAYSRYSYDLPALHRVLEAVRMAPVEKRQPRPHTVRRLTVAIGSEMVRRMVDDCERGLSQTAAARKYGVSQSSVSKYVLAARRSS